MIVQGYFNSPKGTTAALSVGAILFCLNIPNENQLGTGGVATNDSANSRKVINYLVPFEGQGKATSTFNEPPLTPAGVDAEKNLAHIEAILRPSVTELASALCISRQAIYDWKRGNQISPDNSEKLRELAAAADAFAGQDEQFIHHILRRKIGGHNFFGRVGNGESPINMAKKLLEIAQTELRQREMISAQLKDHPARTDIIAVPGRHYQDENG